MSAPSEVDGTTGVHTIEKTSVSEMKAFFFLTGNEEQRWPFRILFSTVPLQPIDKIKQEGNHRLDR